MARIIGTASSQGRFSRFPAIGDNTLIATYYLGTAGLSFYGNILYSSSTAMQFGYYDNYPFLISWDGTGQINFQKTYTIDSTKTYPNSAYKDSSSGYIYASSYANTTNGRGYIYKIDSTGEIVWAKGDSGNNALGIIDVDSSGNMYVQRYIGESERISKVNSSGTAQWQKVANNGLQIRGGGLNSSGTYLYTHGYTRPSGGNRMWLRQYSTSDGSITNKKYVSAGSLGSGSVIYDTSGNLYWGGGDSDGVGNNAFLLKTDGSLNLTWSKTITSGNNMSARATDSSGNVYCSLDYAYMMKFNSSGTLQWQRQWTSSGATLYLGRFTIVGNNILGSLTADYGGGSVYGVDFIVPADGSKTGTYSVGGKSFTYASSGLSVSNGSYSLSGDSTTTSTESYSYTTPTTSVSSLSGTRSILTI